MPNLLLKTAYTSAILVVLSLLGTLTLHADPGVFDDRSETFPPGVGGHWILKNNPRQSSRTYPI